MRRRKSAWLTLIVREQVYLPPHRNEIRYYHTESGDTELVLTRGQARSYPWHVHMRHWTVGVVRSGSALLAVGSAARKLSAGHHFFIRPYEPHRLAVAPESSLIVFCFGAPEVFPAGGPPAPILPHGASFLSAEENALIQSALAACQEETARDRGRPPSPGEDDTVISRSVRAVMSLIMESPDELLSVAKMADYAGYSRWHFLRAFQKVAGLTPHAFQLLCRLRLLRSLLRTETTTAALAVSAGFFDQSHMHRMFKHHHGLTPGEFRQASFRLEP